MTGEVLERHPTPGSMTYAMVGDPPPRRSPLAGTPVQQQRPAVAGTGAATAASPDTGAQHAFSGARHGQEWRDGKLWTTSTVRAVDFPDRSKNGGWWSSAFRRRGQGPHGLAWEGRYLWHGDSDYKAFFKFDPGIR